MKKTNPKVTLLIPVYNGEKFVKQAIESALNQTYENLEIIVINDGSTDNTDTVIKQYTNKIKYIKKENGGVSSALNLAIKNMTGDYFSWLSHDDLYYPNKIEEDVKFMLNLNDDKGIVFSDFQIMDELGNIIQNIQFDHVIFSKFYLSLILKSSLNGITLLIPKKAFEECGLFDEKLICVQDYAKWGDMLNKGYTFYHLDKILTITRTHSNQTTHTSPAMLKEGNELWEYIDNKIPESTKKNLYRTKYNYYRMFESFLKDSPYKIAYEKMKNLKLKYDSKPKNIPVSVVIIGDYDKEKNEKSLNSILEDNIDVEIISTVKEDSIYFYSESIDECINKCKGDYVAFLRIGDKYKANNLYNQSNEMNKCKSIISMNSTNNFQYLDGHILSEILLLPHFESLVMIEKNYIKTNDIKFDFDFRYGVISCLREIELLGLENNKVEIEELHYSQNDNIEFLKSIMRDKILSTNRLLTLKLCNLIANENKKCLKKANIIQKIFFALKEYGLKEVIRRIKNRIIKWKK